MKPWMQVIISIAIAAIIGVTSGYVSAQIALAVQAEKISQNKEYNHETRRLLERHSENYPLHRH